MSGLRESDRWHVLTGDAVAEHEVRAATGVTPLAARVMVARGIRTAAQAREFLTPSLERDWLDPRELPGLVPAAGRVERAVRNHEVTSLPAQYATEQDGAVVYQMQATITYMA